MIAKEFRALRGPWKKLWSQNKEFQFFFRKIDVLGRNWPFFSMKLPSNNILHVKQTWESDCKRLLGFTRSLKKVMLEKQKSFNFFFGKIDIFGQNGHFFLLKTAFKQLNQSKTDLRKRLQKSLRLYKVVKKSNGQKTKNSKFFFFGKIDIFCKKLDFIHKYSYIYSFLLWIYYKYIFLFI